MFFWGQDVQRPTGNFLKEQGFERGPSKGAKGTSCYRLPWQGGHVELYGACVGWYGAEGGFTFIRPRRRCFIWESGEETPVPGAWQVGLLKPASGRELYEASVPFLDWLLAYEDAVLARIETRTTSRIVRFRRHSNGWSRWRLCSGSGVYETLRGR